jgi:hypothetical protein
MRKGGWWSHAEFESSRDVELDEVGKEGASTRDGVIVGSVGKKANAKLRQQKLSVNEGTEGWKKKRMRLVTWQMIWM